MVPCLHDDRYLKCEWKTILFASRTQICAGLDSKEQIAGRKGSHFMNHPQVQTKTLARGIYRRGICAECGAESQVRLETSDDKGTDLCDRHVSAAVHRLARQFAHDVIVRGFQAVVEKSVAAVMRDMKLAVPPSLNQSVVDELFGGV